MSTEVQHHPYTFGKAERFLSVYAEVHDAMFADEVSLSADEVEAVEELDRSGVERPLPAARLVTSTTGRRKAPRGGVRRPRARTLRTA